MELKDKDLISIQEVRRLLLEAYEAQKILQTFDQQKIDGIVKAISDAGEANAQKLAKLANEETGFGKWQDKVIKNLFAAKFVYNTIKDTKTIGILRDDKENKLLEIAVPVGVIAGIVPSTNPTSTAIYKAMIAIKGGNAIVFSPHPAARKCTLEAVRVIAQAAEAAGCPKGAIAAISVPTLQGTQELMKSAYTSLILATGGEAMVKAAYSSGNPAIGVGAGNGPAYIDKSADVKMAVKRILDSKTFDNGTICAAEQSIVIEKCMEEKVVSELKAQGAHILDEEDSNRLAKYILRANYTMNPEIVGKSVSHIAKLAGLQNVPKSARVLIGRGDKIGNDAPYSKEKLAPILALFVEDSVEHILKKCVDILHFEGAGHSFIIHANDDEIVKRFALKVPASRIIVNSPGALGGIGATTNLFPALTLGCGAIGGSSSSNNIGPLDVINIKRVAYGVRELSEIREDAGRFEPSGYGISEDMVEQIVQKIMKQFI